MNDNTYIYRVDCSRLPREQYIAMLDAFDSWCAVCFDRDDDDQIFQSLWTGEEDLRDLISIPDGCSVLRSRS